MAQINVSLPDELSAWTALRVIEGHYRDSAEYLRDLVRRDREQEHIARLQAAIDEGRASGVSEHDPFEYLAELRAGLRTAGGSADAA